MAAQPEAPEFVKMQSCNDVELIEVDGIIGAGKSFFIQCLVQYLESKGKRVMVIQEPVHRWQGKGGILEHFYADPKRWAYTFQTIAFVHRVQEIKKCLEEARRLGVTTLIAERGPYTDRLFVNVAIKLGNMNELEQSIYPGWWEQWSAVAGKVPNKIIYLNTDLNTAMRRTITRNRHGESGVTHSYQEMLKEEHDKLFGPSKLKLCDEHPTHIHKIDFSRHINIDTENTNQIIDSLIGNSLC